MQVFYEGWQLVNAFVRADAKLPKPVLLSQPTLRLVAGMLEERRDFPVLDVVDALEAMAQPELLKTEEQHASLELRRDAPIEVESVITPEPLTLL